MEKKLQFVKIYSWLDHKWYGRRINEFIRWLLMSDFFCRKLKIKGNGSLWIKKRILGKNNILETSSGTCLDRVLIKIQGSNNKITIGKNTIIGKNCRILLFGNNLNLIIGDNCTFSHDDEILVQENGAKVIIGNDCMVSHHVNIRTSDAHPIFDLHSDTRINNAKDIILGNHVWIGANVVIQKGSIIGDGCVVGVCSVVTHNTGKLNEDRRNNIVWVGSPAKPVKYDIKWDHKLFY